MSAVRARPRPPYMLGHNLFIRKNWNLTYYLLLSTYKAQVNLNNLLALKPKQIKNIYLKNLKYNDLFVLYLLKLARKYYVHNFSYEEKFLNNVVSLIEYYDLPLRLYEREILLQLEGVVFEMQRALKYLDVKFSTFDHEFVYFNVVDCELYNFKKEQFTLVSKGNVYISNLAIIVNNNEKSIRLDWGLLQSIEIKTYGIFLRFNYNFSMVLRSSFNFYVLIVAIWRSIQHYKIKNIKFSCPYKLLPIK